MANQPHNLDRKTKMWKFCFLFHSTFYTGEE